MRRKRQAILKMSTLYTVTIWWIKFIYKGMIISIIIQKQILTMSWLIQVILKIETF